MVFLLLFSNNLASNMYNIQSMNGINSQIKLSNSKIYVIYFGGELLINISDSIVWRMMNMPLRS